MTLTRKQIRNLNPEKLKEFREKGIAPKEITKLCGLKIATIYNRLRELKRVKCLNCGRKMIEVKDPIAKKYTGHLWRCKCMPKGMIISIG